MTSAIIPAHNEQDWVGATVRAVGTLPEIDEILVVDDGSTDSTSVHAEEAGARIIRTKVNRGKGAALMEGIRAARGDILLLLDADLGESATEARRLLAPVLSGEADMAIATFPSMPGKGGGFGLVVRLARWGIYRATGKRMLAPLSGQRALRRSVWERIGRCAPGFGVEVGLTIDALRAGFRVIEVPTNMTHRVTGWEWKSIWHRAKQFWAVVWALWVRR